MDWPLAFLILGLVAAVIVLIVIALAAILFFNVLKSMKDEEKQKPKRIL